MQRFFLKPHSSGPPPSGTTWSPTNLNANVTLTNGNLTATPSGGAPVAQYLSGLASASVTGKKYWEVTRVARDVFNGVIGIANASFLFGTNGNSLGDGTANGVAFLPDAGELQYNNAGVTSGYPTGGVGSIFGFAIDATGSPLLWVTGDGVTWNAGGGADPATATGGYAVLFAGAVFPGYSLGYDGTAVDVWTINTGASPFAYTVPAGFTGV